MSGNCVKCDVECSDGADKVSCVECNEVQHAQCAGLSVARMSTRNRPFKCKKCKNSGSLSSVSDNEESTILKAINSLRGDFNSTLEKNLATMEEKINKLVQDKVSELERRIVSWHDTVNNAISEIKSENVALRSDNDTLKSRCDDLTRQVSVLMDNVQDLQQYSRIDNLEIVGVPLTKNENVYAIVEAVARSIKTPWRREDVSIAHRLPRGRQVNPNIIVRLTTRLAKTTWLQAARNIRLTADMLHNTFPKGPVYINEHLSAHSKATLSRAKQLVKEKQLAFAWVKEGKILVKKSPDGRATRVRSIGEVEAAVTQQHPNGRGSTSRD